MNAETTGKPGEVVHNSQVVRRMTRNKYGQALSQQISKTDGFAIERIGLQKSGGRGESPSLLGFGFASFWAADSGTTNMAPSL